MKIFEAKYSGTPSRDGRRAQVAVLIEGQSVTRHVHRNKYAFAWTGFNPDPRREPLVKETDEAVTGAQARVQWLEKRLEILGEREEGGDVTAEELIKIWVASAERGLAFAQNALKTALTERKRINEEFPEIVEFTVS